MKSSYSQSTFVAPAKQQGMVLIVGLVMVLLLTIIGLAAIRGSGLQESMAANMRDTNMAFQAAESAVRTCEGDLNPANLFPPENPACGYVSDLNTTPAQSILNNDTYRLEKSKKVAVDLDYIAAQPLGLVEKMLNDKVSHAAMHGLALGMQGGKNQTPVDSYRVTVSAAGLSEASQVILQTTYYR